jgi:hypothetical protein
VLGVWPEGTDWEDSRTAEARLRRIVHCGRSSTLSSICHPPELKQGPEGIEVILRLIASVREVSLLRCSLRPALRQFPAKRACRHHRSKGGLCWSKQVNRLPFYSRQLQAESDGAKGGPKHVTR